MILGMFLAFTIASGVAMYLQPPVHRAVAKFVFQTDRTSLLISGLSGQQARRDVSPQVLQSEVQQMQSRDVLYPVAVKMLESRGAAEGSLEPEEARIEKEIRSLKSEMTPVVVPETNVLEITYDAKSSKRALAALELIVNHYLAHRTEANSGSAKLLEFYDTEQGRVGNLLNDLEQKLGKWQADNNITVIYEQQTSMIRMMAEQQKELQLVEAQMQTSVAQDPLVGRLKGSLVDSEVQLANLRQLYTDRDRRVQLQAAQLALLRQEFDGAKRNLSSAMAQKRDSLRRQIAETQKQVIAIQSKKADFDRLTREIDVAKNSYTIYGKSLEESRIAAKLDQQQLSAVTLIERPHFAMSNDLSNRFSLVALAAVVGLVIGVAFAFALEFLNNSIRTSEDVEYFLRLPVLAAIPDLRG
jgi:uncharacterized protein involved in exopolysaccharide biosynthesis